MLSFVYANGMMVMKDTIEKEGVDIEYPKYNHDEVYQMTKFWNEAYFEQW